MAAWRRSSGGNEWLDDEAGPLVRLYGVTSGRTHAAKIPLDLLSVIAAADVHPASTQYLGPEHLAILRLCARPTAVVEIGADLDLPLGVLRVLLADLHELELITIRPPNHGALHASVHLLEELLDGLQRL
ncbi:DUF742 domain-containing protein [Micromonospora sp. NPDC023814]|uniref:DUF742 domain-containing protein n=1 Tax=Micromonospora sp. NPDC023814 TaxID=3154596 RepID=UPI0033D50362